MVSMPLRMHIALANDSFPMPKSQDWAINGFGAGCLSIAFERSFLLCSDFVTTLTVLLTGFLLLWHYPPHFPPGGRRFQSLNSLRGARCIPVSKQIALQAISEITSD